MSQKKNDSTPGWFVSRVISATHVTLSCDKCPADAPLVLPIGEMGARDLRKASDAYDKRHDHGRSTAVEVRLPPVEAGSFPAHIRRFMTADGFWLVCEHCNYILDIPMPAPELAKQSNQFWADHAHREDK